MPVPKCADPSKIRLCEAHPDGRTRTSNNPDSKVLDALSPQSCSGKEDYVCSGGFCWATCGLNGDGPSYKWCWLSYGKDGGDDFVTCSEGWECAPDQGNGCSSCSSWSCGCSC